MIIIVRVAVEDDIKGICELLDKEYRKDYFMPEKHVRRLVTGESDDGCEGRRPLNVWIATGEERVIGFARVSHKGNLMNLLVAKDLRGEGIGKVLLKMSNPNIIRAKLDVVTGDPTSFYLESGYVLNEHFSDCGSNILFLEKENTEQPMLRG